MAEELRDILRNRVKEKLARDEVVASMTVRLSRSIEIARIAATAGFDTIYVDVEHNTLSMDAVCQICVAAMQCGITPLVRVPANTPEFICRLLDGGAMGVIAPHVRSADEAREVVRYAKFTPQGERGAGGALPHYHYRSFPSAVVNQAMNDATMVVVMMETVAALEHVEEIAAVDGVDMMLIGTNDLCNEMGITGQFDHANVRDAYLRTIAACRKHGKHVGVGGLASRPDLMAEYVRQGARYVSTGTDLSFLLAAAGGEGEVRAGYPQGQFGIDSETVPATGRGPFGTRLFADQLKKPLCIAPRQAPMSPVARPEPTRLTLQRTPPKLATIWPPSMNWPRKLLDWLLTSSVWPSTAWPLPPNMPSSTPIVTSNESP